MEVTYLFIPGLGDSGEGHWQNNWLLNFDNAVKVKQDDWDKPQLNEWLIRLKESLASIQTPVIAIAHSLGTALLAHWAKDNDCSKVIGAFLVAPPDVDSVNHAPEVIRCFAPMPINRLPFPTLLIASENDPYADICRAEFFAQKWGSEFVNVGSQGHLNVQSNLGLWKEGEKLFKQFESPLIQSRSVTRSR